MKLQKCERTSKGMNESCSWWIMFKLISITKMTSLEDSMKETINLHPNNDKLKTSEMDPSNVSKENRKPVFLVPA